MNHFTRLISLLLLVGAHGARTRSLQQSIVCANDDSYHLPEEPDHDCHWVKSTEAFRQKYCQSESVKSKCSISCGECCEDDDFFTFTINEVGVNVPVSSPAGPSKGQQAGPSKGQQAGPSKGRKLAGPSKGQQAGPSKGSPTTLSPTNAAHRCEWLNKNDNAKKYCETETFGGRKVQDGKNEPHYH